MNNLGGLGGRGRAIWHGISFMMQRAA
jgi:hypothetical protein